MKILALTGPIGVGKTTMAHILVRMGVPCFHADGEIHRLLGPNGAAVQLLLDFFGDMIPGLQSTDGGLQRSLLAHHVINHPTDFDQLETLLHPLVYQAQHAFLQQQSCRHRTVVVLDIPLLFEKGWDQYCDKVVLLTAPDFLRKKRVLSRPGMTLSRLAVIEARQWPLAAKRLQADYVIPTGSGFRASIMGIKHVLKDLKTMRKSLRPQPRVRRRFHPVKGQWMLNHS